MTDWFKNPSIRIPPIRVTLFQILIVTMIVLIAYGMWTRAWVHHPLKFLQSPIVTSMDGCDGWAAVHLFFYMALAFLFPDCEVILLTASIMWEVIEALLNNTNDMNAWWYGRMTDISYNAIGIVIGSHAARALKKKNRI